MSRILLRTSVAIALIGLLAACGATRSATDSSPKALYQNAIEDARTAEPSEITTSLAPLVPYNDSLTWRNTDASAQQVLVVTWGNADALPNARAGERVTASDDAWVTAVPKLRRFCQRVTQRGDSLQLRLAQRLGLPPDADHNQFVELWVRPQNLVRPCPDPAVTDRECGLNAPEPASHVQISDSHERWFQGLKENSYGADGYPFTGLGYTYDWNPATDEVGLSEFVLRTGESGEVRATYTTDAYCEASDAAF